LQTRSYGNILNKTSIKRLVKRRCTWVNTSQKLSENADRKAIQSHIIIPVIYIVNWPLINSFPPKIEKNYSTRAPPHKTSQKNYCFLMKATLCIVCHMVTLWQY